MEYSSESIKQEFSDLIDDLYYSDCLCESEFDSRFKSIKNKISKFCVTKYPQNSFIDTLIKACSPKRSSCSPSKVYKEHARYVVSPLASPARKYIEPNHQDNDSIIQENLSYTPTTSLSNRSPSRSLSNRSPTRSVSNRSPTRSVSNRSCVVSPVNRVNRNEVTPRGACVRGSRRMAMNNTVVEEVPVQTERILVREEVPIKYLEELGAKNGDTIVFKDEIFE